MKSKLSSLSAISALSVLSVVVALGGATCADAAQWQVDASANYQIGLVGGDNQWGVGGLPPQPDVEWRFASSDGLDFDTLGGTTPTFRNYGGQTLTTGLTIGDLGGLTEGVLQPHQGGISHNGTADFEIVDDATALSPGAADFWAGAWMRTTSSAATITAIFGKYSISNPSNKTEWALSLYEGSARALISPNGATSTLSKVYYSSPVNDGKWHLFSITWINDSLRLYIDGAPNVSSVIYNGAMTAVYQGTAKPLVGARDSGAPAGFFPGDIAWAVYDTGASVPNNAQMLALYTAMAPTGAAGKPFPTIQSAAYARAVNDTIYVQPGRYQETVVLTKAGAVLGSGLSGLSGLSGQVSMPELYGALLPAAAGTVGITNSAKQNIGFIDVRGYVSAKGILCDATSDGTIIHHAVVDSCLNGVDFDGASDNDSLINCVIDGAGLTNAIGWRATTSASATLVLKNNVFVNCKTALTKAVTQTLVETNNCFYNNTTNYAAALDASDLLVNPLFYGGNDYRPLRRSRILDAGVDIHCGLNEFSRIGRAAPMGAWDGYGSNYVLFGLSGCGFSVLPVR